MFEDYLEDSYYLALKARESTEEREKKRYYRASVFYAISSIEAFINYIGDTFAKGEVFEPYEIAFLNDKKFGISKKGFGILEQMEYHRLEEKIRFLISKFIPTFDFSHEIVWAHFVEFKKFRDTIMHPRQDEDKIKIEEYDKRLKTGLSSIIKIIDQLCKGIFKKKLRKKIAELSL